MYEALNLGSVSKTSQALSSPNLGVGLNPVLAAETFRKMNPVVKYRRSPLLDTAQWKKSFGKGTGQLTDHSRKPLTKAAFLCWAKDKQALTENLAITW